MKVACDSVKVNTILCALLSRVLLPLLLIGLLLLPGIMSGQKVNFTTRWAVGAELKDQDVERNLSQTHPGLGVANEGLFFHLSAGLSRVNTIFASPLRVNLYLGANYYRQPVALSLNEGRNVACVKDAWVLGPSIELDIPYDLEPTSRLSFSFEINPLQARYEHIRANLQEGSTQYVEERRWSTSWCAALGLKYRISPPMQLWGGVRWDLPLTESPNDVVKDAWGMTDVGFERVYGPTFYLGLAVTVGTESRGAQDIEGRISGKVISDYGPKSFVLVELYHDGLLSTTVRTMANGEFVFGSIPDGRYELRVPRPEQVVAVTPGSCADGRSESILVTLTAECQRSDNNIFRIKPQTPEGSKPKTDTIKVRPATIAGRVIVDTKQNQKIDEHETSRSNMVVELRDISGGYIGHTTTLQNGWYCFDFLTDGIYQISVPDQYGYKTITVRPDGSGRSYAKSSDVIVVNVESSKEEDYWPNDFLVAMPPPMTVCVTVIRDRNYDGKVGKEDEVIKNPITLRYSNGRDVYLENPSKQYPSDTCMEHVEALPYFVDLNPLPCIVPVDCIVESRLGMKISPKRARIVGKAGEEYKNGVVFLVQYKAKLSGKVEGLPKGNTVTVVLSDNSGVVKRSKPDNSGRYGFDDLRLGEYSVKLEGLPPGYTIERLRISSSSPGRIDKGDMSFKAVRLDYGTDDTPCDQYDGYDFSLSVKLDQQQISGHVYCWRNNPYLRGPAAEGVTVRLATEDGRTIQNQVTDQNGRYSFNVDRPGIYYCESESNVRQVSDGQHRHDATRMRISIVGGAAKPVTVDFFIACSWECQPQLLETIFFVPDSRRPRDGETYKYRSLRNRIVEIYRICSDRKMTIHITGITVNPNQPNTAVRLARSRANAVAEELTRLRRTYNKLRIVNDIITGGGGKPRVEISVEYE